MKLETLLVELLPSLRRYALFLTCNTSESDDLVHECVVRILANKVSFDQNRELKPWAFRILRNVFYDDCRKKTGRPSLPIEELTGLEEPSTCGDQMASLQLRETLKAIDELPELSREIFIHVSIEGLSYKDVSACLDIPIGTVMSRLSRARKQLVASLGERATNLDRPDKTP